MQRLDLSRCSGITDRVQPFEHIEVDYAVVLPLADDYRFPRRIAQPRELGFDAFEHWIVRHDIARDIVEPPRRVQKSSGRFIKIATALQRSDQAVATARRRADGLGDLAQRKRPLAQPESLEHVEGAISGFHRCFHNYEKIFYILNLLPSRPDCPGPSALGLAVFDLRQCGQPNSGRCWLILNPWGWRGPTPTSIRLAATFTWNPP